MRRFIVALLLLTWSIFRVDAQQPAAKAAAPANDIFSGTVTASTPEAVTVVRKVPAKADESRIFVVDKDTKIEGRIRVNARVTVRFKAGDDGAMHALRIIVRSDVKTQSAGKTTK